MAQIVGVFRIGRDAEVRQTPSGNTVANVALAFNYGRRGDDGSTPSQWVEAAIWGKRAEALAPYLVKGQQIYAVINEPHVETYSKRDGGEGSKLVGTIAEVELVGGRKEGGDSRRAAAPAPAPKPAAKSSAFDDMDDDIPF